MSLLTFALLLLPLLEQLHGTPQAVLNANLKTGNAITAACEVASTYQPAWELAARAELADDVAYADEVVTAIKRSSSETGLDPNMIWAVCFTESHGRHTMENGLVKRGGSGEIGIMQVLPWWKRGLKREYGIEVDLYDVTDNIRAGCYILRRGGEKTQVMLSYYNTGQRIHNTPYQRKVMRYMGQLETGKNML